jgi:hypothetical protein
MGFQATTPAAFLADCIHPVLITVIIFFVESRSYEAFLCKILDVRFRPLYAGICRRFFRTSEN